MAATDRYRSGMSRFCKREFGVDIGDACRDALSEGYKDQW